MLEERRRIARDVHDFVGHGLAAVMLQVTSARHVLRRDPAAAEEALQSAEEVGRRSMGELRRTVGAAAQRRRGRRDIAGSLGEGDPRARRPCSGRGPRRRAAHARRPRRRSRRASAWRCTGSPRRRWRTRLVTRRGRGRCSSWSWPTGTCCWSPRRAGPVVAAPADEARRPPVRADRDARAGDRARRRVRCRADFARGGGCAAGCRWTPRMGCRAEGPAR